MEFEKNTLVILQNRTIFIIENQKSIEFLEGYVKNGGGFIEEIEVAVPHLEGYLIYYVIKNGSPIRFDEEKGEYFSIFESYSPKSQTYFSFLPESEQYDFEEMKEMSFEDSYGYELFLKDDGFLYYPDGSPSYYSDGIIDDEEYLLGRSEDFEAIKPIYDYQTIDDLTINDNE